MGKAIEKSCAKPACGLGRDGVVEPVRACLHGGGGPQAGHPTYHVNVIK